VIDHCQRQKAPGLLGVLRRLRQAPQLSPIKVLSKPNRRGHGKPPLFATVNHKSLRRETVDREAYSHAAGITSFFVLLLRHGIEAVLAGGRFPAMASIAGRLGTA